VPLLTTFLLACVGAQERDAHPWYRERETLEKDGRESSVLYPFYERTSGKSGESVQVRPFYSRQVSPDGKEVRTNILGPVYIKYESEHFVSVRAPLYYRVARKTPGDESWFAILLPFVFVGSDDFLIFPFGGTTHGFLGYDRLTMVTPFYIQSQMGDFKAHNAVWPFVSWGTDGKEGGRRRFRVVPFYGSSRGGDGSESGFVAWPFYTYKRNPEKEESSFLLFPFVGRTKTATESTTTVMFPFYHARDNYLTGEKSRAVWPFYQRAGGADALDVRRAWPFYEYRRTGYTTTRYWAWPLVRKVTVDDGQIRGRLDYIVPFVQKTRYVNDAGQLHKKKIIWPIGRWETYFDGTREVKIPRLIPFDSPASRQQVSSFTPFFTLFSKRVTPDGDADRKWIFGLIQSRSTNDSMSVKVPLLYSRRTHSDGNNHVRVLGGLVGIESKEGQRSLRLLWGIRIPIGGSNDAAATDDQTRPADTGKDGGA